MKRIGLTGWPLLLMTFILVTVVFFYQTFSKGYLPIPTDALIGLYHPWRDVYAKEYPRGVPFKNFLITDPIRQQIPWRKLVIDTWKSGHTPGWNPYTFVGVPLNANIQAAPFYALNILFFLFTFPIAWTLLVMAQPLLAGLFLFLYLRNRRLSHVASFVGGIVWAFSGFSVAWMTWGTIMQTALWAPLILLSLDNLLLPKAHKPEKSRIILWMIILAGAIAMTVTAGHIQVALYTMTLAAFYVFWSVKSEGRTMGARWVIVAVGGAILLTAVQWIPLLQFLPQTGRAGAADAWKVAGWFLPWQNLVQFVAPDFFGNPATLNYWGVWNYGEFIGYIGILPLVFALSAVFLSGIPIFFSVVLCVSFLFMTPNPVSGIPFVLHIPFLSILQPTRLMAVVDLSLAVLAAYGLEAMTKHKSRAYGAFAVVGLVILGSWGVVLAGKFISHDPTVSGNLLITRHNLVLPTLIFAVGLLWYAIRNYRNVVRWRLAGEVALILIVIFDLFRFGWKFTPFTPQAYFFPTTQTIQYLQHIPKPFRVMSLDDRILPPNAGSYYGIETIEGYDPIAPRLYEDFLVASERGKADTSRPTGFNRIYTAHNIDSPLLPYLNVRYVLSLTDVSRPFLTKVYEEGEVRVYEYKKALPRIYLAESLMPRKNSQDVLQTLFTASPGAVGVYDPLVPIQSLPLAAEEGARITSYQPNEIHVRVTAAYPRVLILLNEFDAHWAATIDNGGPFTVFPVNYLFMGVNIPMGSHTVVFTYR